MTSPACGTPCQRRLREAHRLLAESGTTRGAGDEGARLVICGACGFEKPAGVPLLQRVAHLREALRRCTEMGAEGHARRLAAELAR
jgi:hypothetical protein